MNDLSFWHEPIQEEFKPMMPPGRRRIVLPVALFAVAVAAAVWTFYHWHQKGNANITAALHSPSSARPASHDAKPGPVDTADIEAASAPSQVKSTVQLPGVNDEPIAAIDQGAVEIDPDIYEMVREAIHTDFPELDLSQDELWDLSDTITQLRDALAHLRDTERVAENAGTFQQLEEMRDKAIWDFERITGMRLHEFLRRLPADGGLDNEQFDTAEIILEPLSNYQP